MTDNTTIMITIAGMAAVTYLTRFLGFYLSDRMALLPPLLERVLNYIPGTIIVSIIAPQILNAGTPGVIAALVCVGAAIRFKNLIVVMLTGVVTVSILRSGIFI